MSLDGPRPGWKNMQRAREGQRTWGRKISWGGVAAVAVAMLFLIPSAASAKPATSLKAPYSGSVYSGVQGSFTGCSGTGNVSWASTPSFNLTNGRGYVAGQSGQGVCKKGAASSDATAYTELVSATFALTTGHHSLVATWSASYSIDLLATPGPSPQTAGAEADLYTFAYIYDLTNTSTVYAAYSTNLIHTVTSGSLVTSYHNVALSDFVNGTFVAGHVYEVVVLLELEAESTVSAGKSTASAEVNAAKSGEKGTLTSIKIT
jgi:hypothetical protein